MVVQSITWKVLIISEATLNLNTCCSLIHNWYLHALIAPRSFATHQSLSITLLRSQITAEGKFSFLTMNIIILITIFIIIISSSNSIKLPGAVDHSLSIVSHEPEQNCQIHEIILHQLKQTALPICTSITAKQTQHVLWNIVPSITWIIIAIVAKIIIAKNITTPVSDEHTCELLTHLSHQHTCELLIHLWAVHTPGSHYCTCELLTHLWAIRWDRNTVDTACVATAGSNAVQLIFTLIPCPR